MVQTVMVVMVPVGHTATAHHQVANKSTIPIRTQTESPTLKSIAATATRALSPTRSRMPKRVGSARYGDLPLAQSIVDMAVDMRKEIWMITRPAWDGTKGYTGMRGTQTITFRMDSREAELSNKPTHHTLIGLVLL
jgi:hypothetical protein